MQIGFAVSATQYSKQRVGFIFAVLVKKAELIELKKTFNIGQKIGKLGEMRERYTEQKSNTVAGMWKCEWCNFYKTEKSVKEHLRPIIPKQSSNASGPVFGHYNAILIVQLGTVWCQSSTLSRRTICIFSANFQIFKRF